MSLASKTQSQKLFEKLKSHRANKVCFDCNSKNPTWASVPFVLDQWQWDQLRIMKVGGNESATKYFQSNGGSAALADKDPKVKYGSNAATKYKEELKKRSAEDAKAYPKEVMVETGEEVASPEKDEDFFSSWDKPSIKRPTPPPSRTATPPVIGRTPSPLNPNGETANNTARVKSPLNTPTTLQPAAPRITTSSALRTKSGVTGARKGGVLGAKKGAKLGAKKVGVGEIIDFDEAEKKAKEEAERIAQLGYDPEAEEEEEAKKDVGKSKATPMGSAVPATSKNQERRNSNVDRLGLSMNRLGFGQVAGGKPAAQTRIGGFGSVGTPVSSQHDDDETFAREKFGGQKGITSDEFFGRDRFDPQQAAEARTRLQGFDGATAISSNQYFGREEEDLPANRTDLSNLEVTAREFARRFAGTAGDDIENITLALGQGASKIQDVVKQYLR